jgi:hypothetical protein
MRSIRFLLVLAGCCLALPAGAAGPSKPPPPLLSQLPRWLQKVEAAQMIASIVESGADMGPGSGWFHPSQSLYSWEWLARRMDANGDGVITPDEFKGPIRYAAALDRDRDRRLTRLDFDWSGRAPHSQQDRFAQMLFYRADGNANGRISVVEWEKLFRQAARGKDYLTPDDLRDLLFPAMGPQRPGGGRRAGGPPRALLLAGLLMGELGSLQEGPKLGQMAPDFTLKTNDNKREVRLSSYRGKKPVVLIFGSFT